MTAPSRAVPEGRKVGDEADRLALRIGLAGDGTPLAQLIESSTLLVRVAPDDPTAYARVYTIAPRESVADGDPVPGLGALTEVTIAVVGPDGQLLVPDRRADADGTPRQVCDDLETFARYRRVLELDNPGSSLTGVVDLALLRKAPDGSWVVAEPDPVEGRVVYRVGDLMGLRITSRHTAPLYPAVIDLGLTYGVQVFPGCEGKEVLDPGNTLDVVDVEGVNLEVNIPKSFPLVPTGSSDTDTGVETFKLFVTTQPADYTFLEQEGVQSDATRDIGLAQRGTAATTGQP